MEAPTEELEVFSSILLQEYIRLMTAANCFKHENDLSGAKFAISKENYDRMMDEPLQTALIGLDIKFADNVLIAVPCEEFLKQYENKIMKEVALMFWDNYKNRYAKFISIIEEGN
ncbi:MAG: hypothetical protein IJ532_07390 [Alphaproteobacteria bacterium]|nr:hypothetical protein [Alphaproteobacteria bacterium]